MKKLSVLFASLILIFSACTTDIRVQGFVRTNTGMPIENATITIQKSKKIFETTTDRTGLYMFNNVSIGTWELMIEKEDYETQTERFSVSGGSSGNIYQKDFELKLAPKPQ